MLRVETEKLGPITILYVEGRIVIGFETKALREAVLAQPDSAVVILDFTNVTVIDAHGLGALLELRDWAQSKGIEFRLQNVRRLVRQVLEMTNLDSVFSVTPGDYEQLPSEEDQPSEVFEASGN